jgi:hypothetical protein
MCQTPDQIRANDPVCKTLDRYIELRKKEANGNKDKFLEFDIMKTEAEVYNRIGLVQIQQDMGNIVRDIKECKDSPSMAAMFKKNTWSFLGKMFLVSFIIFTAYFTIFAVLGLEEIIKAVVP